MRKIDFQTKASANRNKNKEVVYINSAVSAGIFFLLPRILEICFYIHGYKDDLIEMKICELVTAVTCTILIGIIAYNIKRKRVFIKTNAHLVQAIGWIVVASSIAIPMISKDFVDIHYIVSYPLQYLMLLGFFIVAIGYVFQLAIKIKEEQDLTI
jgi:hypothetical protein